MQTANLARSDTSIHPTTSRLMEPGKDNGYYDPAAPVLPDCTHGAASFVSYNNTNNYSVSCLKRNEASERFGNLPEVTQP